MSWVRFRARLSAMTAAADGQFLATFRARGEAPEASPGQFVQLVLPGVYWPRPFSLLDWQGGAEPSFRILFARVGPGTASLASLAVGAEIEGHGPLGRGFPPVQGPTWMVAGGYGVSPLLFATRRAARPSDVKFFYGARTAASLWPSPELSPSFATLATEDGTIGVRGTVLDAVRAELDATGARPALYACGPMGLLAAVAALAKERGLTALVSVEAPMPCGIGVCRGCALPMREDLQTEAKRYLMACEDGPVLESDRLDWEGERACRT